MISARFDLRHLRLSEATPIPTYVAVQASASGSVMSPLDE